MDKFKVGDIVTFREKRFKDLHGLSKIIHIKCDGASCEYSCKHYLDYSNGIYVIGSHTNRIDYFFKDEELVEATPLALSLFS